MKNQTKSLAPGSPNTSRFIQILTEDANPNEDINDAIPNSPNEDIKDPKARDYDNGDYILIIF